MNTIVTIKNKTSYGVIFTQPSPPTKMSTQKFKIQLSIGTFWSFLAIMVCSSILSPQFLNSKILIKSKNLEFSLSII